MENEILKINIMSIAISGLVMMLAGVMLYIFKDHLTGGSIRFFLPIPPVAVAAYIFVFNVYKQYQCSLPIKSIIISEVFFATLTSTFFFFTFTVALIFLIHFIKSI